MLVFAVAICSAKNNARADVILTDGSVKENVEINLPKGWDKKLKIKSGNTQEVLSADDVDHFVLWHNDSPDKKTLIKRVGVGLYNHKKNEKDLRSYKGWMAVLSAGEHLSYMIWFNKIILKSNTIKYEMDDKSHFFHKSGEEHAFMIHINTVKPSSTRDWLKRFLDDDPVLVEKITEKGYFNRKNPYHQGNNYNPFFFEDIAVDYNPVR